MQRIRNMMHRFFFHRYNHSNSQTSHVFSVIRDNTNYDQKGGVLDTVRSEIVHRFQICKDCRRRRPNSGEIVIYFCPRSLRLDGRLMLDSDSIFSRFFANPRCGNFWFDKAKRIFFSANQRRIRAFAQLCFPPRQSRSAKEGKKYK